MFQSGKTGGWLVPLLAAGLVLLPPAARAGNITLQGSFTHDDGVQLFNFTVATAGSVDLRSYGYAGGTIDQGGGISLGVASGGFDTILTLFDASGQFLSENDDGAGVATDPTTDLAGDARLTQNLAAGSYTLTLTQYDNFAAGTTLAGGFVETGHPNFTADPSFATGGPCPGNMFRDISGSAGRCRTGNWTVNFTNVASVTAVPEPGSIALLCAGLLGLGLLRVKRRRRALALSGLLLGAVSIIARAQGPDYSNVSDFLNGNRTLLQNQDIVIATYQPGIPAPEYTQHGTAVINTANGTTTGQPSQVNSQNVTMTDDRIQRPFAGRLYESPHDCKRRSKNRPVGSVSA